MHHNHYTQSDSYHWIAERTMLYKKLSLRNLESLVKKQKIFYYGQRDMAFPYFDNEYLEIHKKHTNANLVQNIIEDLDFELERE